VTPIIAGDHVIVSSHQAGLLGIKVKSENNAWSAEIAWTRKDAAINFSSPVASGGFLYGVGPNRDVLCVELSTGRTAWSQPGLFVTSADKAYAGLIVVGSNILMLTDSGELILFAASPEKWQELGRVQICSLNWCNPALADGVLYLRDGLKKNGHWKAVRLLETNG
jgi:outer membrane protein assembly factor BamB